MTIWALALITPPFVIVPSGYPKEVDEGKVTVVIDVLFQCADELV